MIRSINVRSSKSSNQRFAVLSVEDFTGNTEVILWSDAYKKAADVDGLLQEGNFVRFRARITEDDRNPGSKRVAASGLELLTPHTRKKHGKERPFYGISLLTSRHDSVDIQLIRKILGEHPGKMPVRITFRNSLGNEAHIELGSAFSVEPSPELDKKLSLFS